MQFKLIESLKEIIKEVKQAIQYPDWVLNNPKVTINGGKIRLYHYGDDGGTGFLDPKYFGKHSYTSDVTQSSVPRVMFYVNPEDKEKMVDGSLFTTDYPLSALYPFNSDPLKFYDACAKEDPNMRYMDEMPVNKQVQCITAKALDAGFKGMIFKWTDTLRVDIFDKVKVHKSAEEQAMDDKVVKTDTLIGTITIDNQKYYVIIPKGLSMDLINSRGIESMKDLNQKSYRRQIPEYLYKDIQFKPEFKKLFNQK